MFNEEMKRRFIRSITSSVHTEDVARGIFDAVEPYEKDEWGADFCTVDEVRLQPVMDKILGMRMSSKWMALTILKKYSLWCMDDEKYPGAGDAIMRVNILGLDKVREQMVANPLHLQSYFDKVFDKEAEETIDNIYRCFLWIAYAGISEDDALKIEIKDINLSELRIVYGEASYPIYREAIPAFKNAIGLTSFVHRHPRYTKTVRKDRATGNTIIRGIRFNTKEDSDYGVNILTIRSQISKRLTEASKEVKDRKTGNTRPALTSLTLSYYRIWMSGLFYRASEAERAGIPPKFSEVSEEKIEHRINVKKKEYKLSARDSLVQKRNRKARDYMDDYRRWKLAYSI
jgi:hypothetical protein